MLNRRQYERLIESVGFARSMLLSFLGIAALSLQNAVAGTAEPVDLTPQATTSKIEGATFHLVWFQAGPTRIKYEPPWPISGRTDCAHLAPPFPGAQATIRRIETQKPLDFAEDLALAEVVKKQIPNDADAVDWGSLTRNPVRINGKETAELIVTYGLFGRRLQMSTLVAQRERGTELFLFQVSTAPGDFKSAHRAFQASLYSISGF